MCIQLICIAEIISQNTDYKRDPLKVAMEKLIEKNKEHEKKIKEQEVLMRQICDELSIMNFKLSKMDSKLSTILKLK